MERDDLQRELKRLADRLARIERHLNIEPPETPPETSPETPPELPPKTLPEASEQSGAKPHAETLASHLRKLREQPGREPDEVVAEPDASAAPPITPPMTPSQLIESLLAPTPPPPKVTQTPAPSVPVAEKKPGHLPPVRRSTRPVMTKPGSGTSMEMLIGGKWMAWLGAAAVFAAAMFAIKIAIDQGWWGRLTPTMKFVLIALGGGLLTSSGEIVLRKIGRVASIGLFSAGIGVLYLDCFATFRYWDLLSKEWAFILMGVVAVGGFALTYRTRALTIGVISIVGGYLTPILLRGQSQHDIEMLSFLTVLLGISLGLAGTSPRPFGPLRFVALGAHGFVALGWLLANGPTLWIVGLVFMSLWWTMTLTESVIAAVRDHSTTGNIVMTLLATAGFVTAGCWVLSAGPVAGTDWTGVYTAMIALLAGAVAFYFGPGIDGLRVFPRRAIDKLAVALWIQAAILLATAVALHFDEYGRAVGWLVISLGVIETGRRLPSKGLDIFGLVVGGLALFDVAFVSWWFYPSLTSTLRQWGDLEITGWAILALVAIGATIAGAHRLNDHWPNRWKTAPVVLASLATFGWLAWWPAQSSGLLVTTGWLIGVVIMLPFHRRGARQRYFEIAQLLLFAAAIRWVVVDLVQDRFTRGWDPNATLPLLNGRTGLALAIAASGWWVYRILRRRQRDKDFADQYASYGFQLARQTAVLFIVLIAVLALSFDADRIVERLAASDATIDWVVGHVRQNVLTLMWSAASLVLGLLGRLVTQRANSSVVAPPRLLILASTIILIICAAKWLVLDTLFWLTSRQGGELMPLVNVQMLTGLVLATTGLLLRRQFFVMLENVPGVKADGGWRDPAAWMPVAAALVLLWGASFEVDRLIGRAMTEPIDSAYSPALLRALWWTGLWAAGGLAMALIGFWRHLWLLIASGFWLIVLAALAWLTYDTLLWRFNHAALDVGFILNLQCLIGFALAIMLRGSEWVNRQLLPNLLAKLFGGSNPVRVAHGLIAIFGLWLGTLELDRLFAGDITVRLASFSVYWGLYGVALVAIGFARRAAPIRYAGLALLAVTAAKVLFIDMAEAKNIWRVVSFVAIGLLLIVTSIAYGRLGQLLKDEETETTDMRDN